MANLKEVRLRIASVKSTQQITKAMKMVSAAKFRRATDAIVQMRPYANKLKGMLANLSESVADMDNVFTQDREVNNVLLVVVTSNRGLAGAFNNNVIKATNALIAEKYAEQHKKGNLYIVAVGKKAQDFYTRNNFQVIGNNNELFSKLNFANASAIVEAIMEGFAGGKFDHVEMIYNQYKNAAVQILTHEQLLPLPKAVADAHGSKTDYLFEPTKEEIVEELIPKSIRLQFYKAILDSHAAEHGARMTAMDKATDNAGELLRTLTLQYNQARQAAITNEILEIVSGANALAEA
ncbi:ATP synthase F1 subunit gamma [Solitalea lacus]|uniref:ATP synthase F1 subunit gamma n=1 Tax=Solitalea lacus TaxID=2911172 RepID=UPI001EDACF92|nr:ATP synthase F1 subunit gamma [Solitalea lacus]UKJ07326.1 ATP synthase F1 subunit gamma [Solitalea lacus]